MADGRHRLLRNLKAIRFRGRVLRVTSSRAACGYAATPSAMIPPRLRISKLPFTVLNSYFGFSAVEVWTFTGSKMRGSGCAAAHHTTEITIQNRMPRQVTRHPNFGSSDSRLHIIDEASGNRLESRDIAGTCAGMCETTAHSAFGAGRTPTIFTALDR